MHKEDVVHIHTMQYYPVIKKTKFCHLQQHEWTSRACASETGRERQIYVESKKYHKLVTMKKKKQTQRYNREETGGYQQKGWRGNIGVGE